MLFFFRLKRRCLERGVSFSANRRGGRLNLRRILAFKIALRYRGSGACGLTGNPRNAGKIYSETVPLALWSHKVEPWFYCDKSDKLNLQGIVGIRFKVSDELTKDLNWRPFSILNPSFKADRLRAVYT